jgi:hypothetical protein
MAVERGVGHEPPKFSSSKRAAGIAQLPLELSVNLGGRSVCLGVFVNYLEVQNDARHLKDWMSTEAQTN